jgi:hypothetical protein
MFKPTQSQGIFSVPIGIYQLRTGSQGIRGEFAAYHQNSQTGHQIMRCSCNKVKIDFDGGESSTDPDRRVSVLVDDALDSEETPIASLTNAWSSIQIFIQYPLKFLEKQETLTKRR